MGIHPNLDYYTRLLELLQKEEDVNVNEHDYNMAALGNWYITYEKNKEKFKIRWDGKTQRLYHQLETDEVWLNQNIYRDLSTVLEHDVPVVDVYLEEVLKE